MFVRSTLWNRRKIAAVFGIDHTMSYEKEEERVMAIFSSPLFAARSVKSKMNRTPLFMSKDDTQRHNVSVGRRVKTARYPARDKTASEKGLDIGARASFE